ncbi:MAG TPA: LamG-like jellyroll fold domain-containing protein, partial [Opitutaceae bacterium]
KDATANAAHGTGVNLLPGARVEGRVGKGLALDYPKNQWVKVDSEKRKLFDVTKHVTFSIWAKARTFGNTKGIDGKGVGYETMFAKGDNSWRVQKFGIRSWHNPPADLVEICVEQAPKGDLCAIGRTDMKPGEWYHFVGVHDFPHVKLYVNGVLEMVDRYDTAWTSGDHPVGIGNQSQFPDRGRQWDGVLDEARVMGVAKDAHWIKLDYESQREGQKLVVFGRAHRRW